MVLPLLLGAATLLKTGIGIMGDYAEASALDKKAEIELIRGDYLRTVGETNAKFNDFAEQDVRSREGKEVGKVKRRADQVRGSQRAAAAAQGIDVAEGSAQALQDETVALSEQDMIAAKTNVWREAFGYKRQAAEYRHAGAMAEIEGRANAAALRGQAAATRLASWGSLLTGGLSAASAMQEQFGGGSPLKAGKPAGDYSFSTYGHAGNNKYA